MRFEERLADQLKTCRQAGPAGITETQVPGVRLFWTTVPTPPAPLVYDAGIVVLLQGRKRGKLGEQRFVYDVDNYLVLTLPMPFECAHEASAAEPVCGLFISAEREDLASLLAQIAEFNVITPKTGTSALAPAPMDEGMRAVTHRLLTVIGDPVAGRAIGPSLRREALFHALRGPRGPALAALAQQIGDEGRIDALIRATRRDIGQPVSIEDMARRAGMSLSAFHRAFRTKTGQSPLQYVKRLKLHAARDLITFHGVKVGDAARRVGYESGSQFSREYKRYFGQSATATRDFARQEPAERLDERSERRRIRRIADKGRYNEKAPQH